MSRIKYVGVTDKKKKLFEGLWPLPYGVTYNSYLIVDEKVALIDTVEEDFEEEFLQKIREEIGDRKIDYLIVNHMEPDHSGVISSIRSTYPEVEIIASQKAASMIEGYHGIAASEIRTVKEGETLCLGETSVSFYMAPMVHWPEVMVTWYEAENTLFSADAFGTFGAVEQWNCFDDYREEMTRYYTNIVGKYGAPVQAALKKLSSLPIHRICSTHGPVWEEEAGKVVALYDKLSRYEPKKGVCIVYGSMYGNTAKAAKALAVELEKRGIPYGIHDLCNGVSNPDDLGQSGAIADLFKYNTLVVGSPTYNNCIFPPVASFMDAAAARLVKGRKFFAFGSYTWAAASIKLLNEKAVESGFTLLGEGIAFPQAYSPEKCDMAMVAGLIEKNL